MQSLPNAELESHLWARRNFLVGGTASLLGLLMSPPQAGLAASSLQSNLFLKFVGRFVENVGFNLISSYIYDHIKDYLNPAQRAYVRPELRRRENDGLFTKPDWGSVYGTWNGAWQTKRQPSPYFFTPLLKADGVNGAAQFFDLRSSSQQYWAGTLAAPSLVGLAKAGSEMSKRQIVRSPSQLRAALLPTGGGQVGISCGCFDKSYAEPDEYYSDLGRVWIDYVRNHNHSGLVRIEVFDRRGNRRFTGEYCACPES